MVREKPMPLWRRRCGTARRTKASSSRKLERNGTADWLKTPMLQIIVPMSESVRVCFYWGQNAELLYRRGGDGRCHLACGGERPGFGAKCEIQHHGL